MSEQKSDWAPRAPVFPGEWLEEEQLSLGLEEADGKDVPRQKCPFCCEENTFLAWCHRHQEFVCEDCWIEGHPVFWGS